MIINNYFPFLNYFEFIDLNQIIYNNLKYAVLWDKNLTIYLLSAMIKWINYTIIININPYLLIHRINYKF